MGYGRRGRGLTLAQNDRAQVDLLACTAAIEHLRALCADVKATFSNTEAESIPICVEVRSALRARAQPRGQQGARRPLGSLSPIPANWFHSTRHAMAELFNARPMGRGGQSRPPVSQRPPTTWDCRPK